MYVTELFTLHLRESLFSFKIMPKFKIVLTLLTDLCFCVNLKWLLIKAVFSSVFHLKPYFDTILLSIGINGFYLALALE